MLLYLQLWSIRASFLIFFHLSGASLLSIPGRLYDVSMDYIPNSCDSIVEHAVSTLLDLYDKHQGHTLVFLPGVPEIRQAITLFNRQIPNNCVALPLYSALSPEEQNQVLQFDEGPDSELRMVVSVLTSLKHR